MKKAATASTSCGTIRLADSEDPEQRIRELERRLADAKGGPRENVPAGSEAGPVQVPGMMAPLPPSANPSYDLLRRQMNRRHRFSSIWLVFLVPGILAVAIFVFHPYRVEKHPPPPRPWRARSPPRTCRAR